MAVDRTTPPLDARADGPDGPRGSESAPTMPAGADGPRGALADRLRALLALNAVQRILSSVVLAPLVTFFLWQSPAFATATVCSCLTSLCSYEYSWLSYRIQHRLLAAHRRFYDGVPPVAGDSTRSSGSGSSGSPQCRACVDGEEEEGESRRAGRLRLDSGFATVTRRHPPEVSSDMSTPSVVSDAPSHARPSNDETSEFSVSGGVVFPASGSPRFSGAPFACEAEPEPTTRDAPVLEASTSSSDAESAFPTLNTRCAVSAVAERWCGGRESIAAALLATAMAAVSTASMLHMIAKWLPQLKETELYDYRLFYAATTTWISAFCACFTPDWEHAVILYLEGLMFTVLTLYSTICPINMFSCELHLEPQQVFLATMGALLLFRLVTARRPIDGVVVFGLDLLGFVYIIGTLSVMVAFVDDDKRTIYRKLLIVLLYVTWASDSGAYATGKLLAWWRYPYYHPLAAHLSKNKDYEGTLGAIVCGIIAMFAASNLLDVPGSSWTKVAFTILGVIVGRFGDLFESLIKRAAGVKDSGRLIPGHGGVLDRIDALMFVTLVFARYYTTVLDSVAPAPPATSPNDSLRTPSVTAVNSRDGPKKKLTTTAMATAQRLIAPVLQSAREQSDVAAFVVWCSPGTYRVVWSIILMFHIVNTGIVARSLYSWIRTDQDPEEVAKALRNVGIQFSYPAIRGLIFCAAIALTWHCLLSVASEEFPPKSRVGAVIFQSTRHLRHQIERMKSVRDSVTSFLDNQSQRSASSCIRIVWASIFLAWRALNMCVGAFGIRGQYFDVGFHLRELFEISIQTYQAYRISYLVPQDWVSFLSICVVVLNCWTTPLLHAIFHSNLRLRRVWCLGVDVVLDFFSSMLMPFFVYTAYRRLIIRADWYNPVWIMQTANALLCFHINSPLDLVSRILPNLSMLSCLGAIQPLLRAQPADPNDPVFVASLASKPIAESSHHARRQRRLHIFLMVYGLCVIGLQSAARLQADSNPIPGCQLATKRWFATKPTCAVLELNCHRRNWTGSAQDLDSVLKQVDEQTLAALIVSHCLAVEISLTIHRFPNLVWLEIYNSTLVDWPSHAAPSNAHNPRLSRVLMVHTNFSSGFPSALLSMDGKDDPAEEFPSTLIDIEFVSTNLTELPLDIGLLWPDALSTFLVESSGLTAVPPALGRLDVETLSLAGNDLTSLPLELVDDTDFDLLSLAGNPLRALPNVPVILVMRRSHTVSNRLDCFHLECSRPVFRFVWWLVLSLNALHAGALARATFSLIRTLRFPRRTQTLLRAIGEHPNTWITLLGAVCAITIVVLHVVEMLRLLWLSLQRRQLCFLDHELKPFRRNPTNSRLRGAMHSIRIRINQFRRLYSIRGPYFEHAFHAREILEISLQTLQAYRVSYFVVHPWVNQLAMAVIVLNCWSSALIYHVFPHHQAKRRVLCLLIDIVLDMTSSMVIPYIIYGVYRYLLNFEDYYDPIWIRETANDLLQVTNVSMLDLLARLMAAGSIVISLQTVQTLIKAHDARAKIREQPSTMTATSPAVSRVSADRGGGSGPHRSVTATSSVVPLPHVPVSRPRPRWISVLHGLFVVYGFLGIFVSHRASRLADSSQRALPGCHASMRHWLALKYPCSILEINCHRRALDGSADELAAVLAELDPNSLGGVILSHCPRVEMPAAILSFPYLFWLELYNSTLLEWPVAAALSAARLPRLSNLALVRVNVTESRPRGLLPGSGRREPSTLQHVAVVRSNLSLTSELLTHWGSDLDVLVVEHCGLQAVPPAMAALRVTVLSLAANALTSVPPSLLFPRPLPFDALSLASNPLESLPERLGAEATATAAVFATTHALSIKFKGLYLENTAVSALPAWARADGLCRRVDLFAGGAPLCAGAARAPPCDERLTHCGAEIAGHFFPMAAHAARRLP
ncbi:hypothetical protein P43SY_007273 [Pythium insidiosum]|uniref:Phosphatidate cytidylyltransferase n=1 Tax=Pythium insidiosum TaxID=114742 RepID=A0AAD5Q323_PYTIN|nr:hypothetical protein P43SY_007273 [Pythium insidiosum]